MSSELMGNGEAGSTIPLCLYGAGGHGRVVARQIVCDFAQALCFGDANPKVGDQVDGILVKFRAIEQIKNHRVLITIGDNTVRRHLQEAAQTAGAYIGMGYRRCKALFFESTACRFSSAQRCCSESRSQDRGRRHREYSRDR